MEAYEYAIAAVLAALLLYKAYQWHKWKDAPAFSVGPLKKFESAALPPGEILITSAILYPDSAVGIDPLQPATMQTISGRGKGCYGGDVVADVQAVVASGERTVTNHKIGSKLNPCWGEDKLLLISGKYL